MFFVFFIFIDPTYASLFPKIVENLVVEGSSDPTVQLQKIIQPYSTCPIESIASITVQAIGQLFVCSPKLLDGAKQLISKALDSPQTKVRQQMLSNIHELLLDAGNQAAESMKRQVNEDSERVKDGGFVIRTYMEQVLNSMMDPEQEVRERALSIIEIAVKYGLIDFKNARSSGIRLIALQTDQKDSVTRKAMSILDEIISGSSGKVDSSTLFPLFLDAVTASAPFQQKLFHKLTAFSSITNANSFAPLYKKLTQTNKREFLCNFIKLWAINSQSNQASFNDIYSKAKTFQYYAEVIASLPFSSEGETSCLIREITKIVATDGHKLKDTLKSMEKNEITPSKF